MTVLLKCMKRMCRMRNCYLLFYSQHLSTLSYRTDSKRMKKITKCTCSWHDILISIAVRPIWIGSHMQAPHCMLGANNKESQFVCCLSKNLVLFYFASRHLRTRWTDFLHSCVIRSGFAAIFRFLDSIQRSDRSDPYILHGVKTRKILSQFFDPSHDWTATIPQRRNFSEGRNKLVLRR